jgi:hypothetical protein
MNKYEPRKINEFSGKKLTKHFVIEAKANINPSGFWIL